MFDARFTGQGAQRHDGHTGRITAAPDSAARARSVQTGPSGGDRSTPISKLNDFLTMPRHFRIQGLCGQIAGNRDMRGIVIGAVFSIVAWTFLAWCSVCACTWSGETSFSGSVLTLVSSLAAIIGAAVMGGVWVRSLMKGDDTRDVAPLGCVVD